MTHLAVDLALRTTGICWGPNPTDSDWFTTPTKLRGGERTTYIEYRIAEYVLDTEPRPTTLVVEGPIMARTHPTGAIPTIKLHGVIEHFAWRNGLTYVEVPHPSVIKKFATGKGNADKQAMIDAARALGYHPDNDNEADAIHIWQWHHQGQP